MFLLAALRGAKSSSKSSQQAKYAVSFSGRTFASQANNKGSIPFTSSTKWISPTIKLLYL